MMSAGLRPARSTFHVPRESGMWEMQDSAHGGASHIPEGRLSPSSSHQVVTKRRKGRPDKAREGWYRRRTRAVRRGGQPNATQSGRIMVPMQ